MSQNQSSTYSGSAVGLTVFAAVMMIIIGLFQAISGFVALVNDEFYVVGQEWVFQLDVTTWGWIHLLLGIVVWLAGIGLFGGQVWARILGVIVAVIVAVINFAWLPWYPIWGAIVITLSIAVIWALTLHGRDITEA